MEDSPQPWYPIDGDDAKHFSGLCTILVATIQEAKDRISQIEYIFCSQLFASFQSRSKSLRRSFSKARKAAEDDWRKKESSLLLQMGVLQIENQQVLEENRILIASLELEKAKLMNDDHLLNKNNETNNLLLAKLGGLHENVDVLQEELRQKIEMVAEGRELQEKLLKRVESKASEIVNNEKLLNEHEEKKSLLLVKLKNLEDNVDELQQELDHKTKEVAEGKELQQKLLQMIELKASVIVNLGLRLNECEKEEKLLLDKLKNLEEKAGVLQLELRQKTIEVMKGTDMEKELISRIEWEVYEEGNNRHLLRNHEQEKKLLLAKLKSLEEKVDDLQRELCQKTKKVAENIVNQEQQRLQQIESRASKTRQQVNDFEKDNKLFSAKLKSLEENIDRLQEEFRKKTKEVIGRSEFQEKLFQSVESKPLVMVNKGELSNEHEKEKIELLAKIKGLEENFDELQEELRKRTKEVAEGRDLHGKLLRQIGLKSSEILEEKTKTRDAVANYKRLKSQYNFVCKKLGLTKENMLPHNRMEEETDSLRHHQNPRISKDPETKDPDTDTSGVASETNKQKHEISFQENLEDDKAARLIQSSSPPSSSTSSSPVAPNCPNIVKHGPLAGIKRPISYWRDTRSHQEQGGADPHDDFLDTPLENVKGNLNKAMKDEIHDSPVQAPKDMHFDSSDDETQNLIEDPAPQKERISIPRPDGKSFKYVEPVRKKAQRENLKGIECKQCKKFYDAVLRDGGGKDSDNHKFHCEHQDGVSRHRYRYVPPLTPEGFWNIGFDSEM